MKKKILIIDDAKEIRQIFRMGLEVEGYEVLDAIHGQDAFDQLAKLELQHLPDLILLDLMMPIMDGHEFIEKFQVDARLGLIPVIIMTAKDKPVFNEKVKPLPILRKPVDLDILLSTIEKYILKNIKS